MKNDIKNSKFYAWNLFLVPAFVYFDDSCTFDDFAASTTQQNQARFKKDPILPRKLS